MILQPDHSAIRDLAIKRGLAFIYQTACDPEYFYVHGSDYLCCFYCISATSSNPELRQMARVMGRERARHWRQQYSTVPHNAGADDVVDLLFGSDAACRLGVRDAAFKAQLRKSAAGFNTFDYLFFDPAVEAPPADVPTECDCGVQSIRGTKTCRRCRRKLNVQSVYWVWFNALTRTYTATRHGIRLGASFADVLKWLPAMRPYPRPETKGNCSDEFYWALYAVTHVVYALNDYSLYKLAPAWLPAEFEFLRRNLTAAIRMEDVDMLGEFLDTLKSFGLTEKDPLIRKGMSYLLSCQNEDGSWGDPEADDIYLRFHPTWTAIDGLRDYAWRGQRLSLQRLQPMLERWAEEKS